MKKILVSLFCIWLNATGLALSLLIKNMVFAFWCSICLYWAIWLFVKSMDAYFLKED